MKRKKAFHCQPFFVDNYPHFAYQNKIQSPLLLLSYRSLNLDIYKSKLGWGGGRGAHGCVFFLSPLDYIRF